MPDSECLVAACASAEFLIQAYSHECGIFDTTPSSHNIVRNLMNRVTKGSPRAIRDETNPDIIVAVLIYSLKTLKFSLFHEVLSEVSKVSVNDGGYDSIKQSIKGLMVRISQDRLRVLRLIMEYVVNLLISQSKVSANGDGRTWGADGINKGPITSQSMAVILANLTCRPFGTSYLSIKHKECASQVAPVIEFILDNFVDVFDGDLKSNVGVSRTEEQLQARELEERIGLCADTRYIGVKHNREAVVTERELRHRPLTGDPVASLARPVDGNENVMRPEGIDKVTSEDEEGVKSPQRRKRRPSSPPPSVSSTCQAAQQPATPSRSGWEWNVLESIVLSRVKLFTAGKLDINLASPSSPAISDSAPRGQVWASAPAHKAQTQGFSSSSSATAEFKENVNTNGTNCTSVSSSPANGSKFSWGGGGAGVMAAQRHAMHSADGTSSLTTPDGGNRDTNSDAKGAASVRRAEDASASASPHKKSRSNYSFTPPVSKPITDGQNARRRTVAECRAIKQQISAWEREFSLSYAASHGGRGKSPRASDRPEEVQKLYEHYKEMKKSIRDSAATDVQRTVRSMLAKKRVYAMKENIRRRMFGDIMSLSSVLSAPLGSPRGDASGGAQSRLDSKADSLKTGGASPDTSTMLLEGANTSAAGTSSETALDRQGSAPRHIVASSVEILSKSGARSGSSSGSTRAGGKVESSLYTSSDSAYSVNASTSMIVTGSAASSRNNSMNLTTSSNSMSVTDASAASLMVSISAPNSVNNSVNASAMDTDISVLTNTAASQSTSGGDGNINNSNSSIEGRISPSGVNIMSSLSFEAGLNINQAASIRGLRDDTRSNSPSFDKRRPSGTVDTSPSTSPRGSSATGATGSMVHIEALKERYLACLARKRDLKRALKRFDESFQASHGGRLPKKEDKEVMRPQYQQYHDSKDELETLKAQIVEHLGHFPEQLLQIENKAPTEVNNSIGTSSSSRAENISHHQAQPSGGSPRTSSPTTPYGKGQTATMTSAACPTVGTAMVPETAPAEKDLEHMSTTQLIEEKKNLHAYLKTYERNFQTEHKRPVTKQDDIAPVSGEYQRYKLLKSLLAQRKDKERISKATMQANSPTTKDDK